MFSSSKYSWTNVGCDVIGFTLVFISILNPNMACYSSICRVLIQEFVVENKKSHFFISPFRPQDGNKPAETSQPQSSTGGYNQPNLGYGQSNYSYPQVPGSYPMQPVTAPPSYPPTRSVSSFLWWVSYSGHGPACFCFLRITSYYLSPSDEPDHIVLL